MSLSLRWVPIGSGQLALSHRPGQRDLVRLAELGCQRVVTLLSEREGALSVQMAIEAQGLQWTWLPLNNGKYPPPPDSERLRAALPSLSSYLDAGEHVLIHCSAGIHRTGMVSYALLRWRGFTAPQTMELLSQLRAHTHAGIQPRQIAWAEDTMRALGRGEPSGAVSPPKA